MEYDYMSVLINQQYAMEELMDEIACGGYVEYPYLFRGDFVPENDSSSFDWCYAYGANEAYKDNPQAVMNTLMALVF